MPHSLPHSLPQARFINHSCNPNLILELVRCQRVRHGDADAPAVTLGVRACFFTRRPVEAGEELCIDYAAGHATAHSAAPPVPAPVPVATQRGETALGNGTAGDAAMPAASESQRQSHTRCLCGEPCCRRWLPRRTAPLTAPDVPSAAAAAESDTSGDGSGCGDAAQEGGAVDPALGALLRPVEGDGATAFTRRFQDAVAAGLASGGPTVALQVPLLRSSHTPSAQAPQHTPSTLALHTT